MKKQTTNLTPLYLKSTTLNFFKVLLNLAEKIQTFLLNFSSNTLNLPQEGTEEDSRKIGQSTVNPRPTPPPSPIREEETEEGSRKIGQSTINPRPTPPPSPIRVRKAGVSKVDPQPTLPPNPIRLMRTLVGTISPRPKKIQNPRR